MEYIEINAQQALHKLNKKMLPYSYDLNIYRGCTHGCKYCYATRSQKYLQNIGNEDDVFVKTNIVEVLERELASPSWQKDIINIGGVCDSYQHCEKHYKLMDDILRLMIKYQNPVIISTKSNLILRDLDLIDELASSVYVNIPICITSVNPMISKKVEPGAALPQERLKTLKEVSRTKAYTGFHVMPILPFLADDEMTLETLASWAYESKASYMLTGVLYMTGGIRKRYMKFIYDEFPQYYEQYCSLYLKGSANQEYKTRIHTMFNQMKEKFGINTSYAKFLPKNNKSQSGAFKKPSKAPSKSKNPQQMSLFE